MSINIKSQVNAMSMAPSRTNIVVAGSEGGAPNPTNLADPFSCFFLSTLTRSPIPIIFRNTVITPTRV